jgi:alpha-N-arabinofuranosidase
MRSWLSYLLIFCCAIAASAQPYFINPILPGGHPDPSICRVGDDFYIVNSSFEYFPALPIHHSTDLVNWELIGYGLHRPEQASGIVNLIDVQQNGGIHAPSIRHHDGLFYIIVTNIYTPGASEDVPLMVNFIITAENPAGPWSDPIYVEGAPGIDPDIFFDDDGKVYFVGTHAPDQPEENGIGEIWVQELDPQNNWQLKGERSSLWKGACGGCCVEGPHIYKKDGIYYLLVAEGGTGTNHAVMIAASPDIRGPYESNPRNPILTTRHLSLNYWVNSTGHADLVEDADGNWYMVCLGIRNDKDGRSNMGRETNLMPVIWEETTVRWQQVSDTVWEPVKYSYPVVSPETGRVDRYASLPFEDKPQHYNDAFADNFDKSQLDLEWNFRRVPKPGTYSLSDNPGYLRLFAKPETFEIRGQFGAIGFRQKESDFEYETRMNFNPKKDGSEAGLSIFQQDNNYINFTLLKKDNSIYLQVVIDDLEDVARIAHSAELNNYPGAIQFKVISGHGKYLYQYSLDGGQTYVDFYESADDIVLCYGYIGTNLGLYATSNGQKSKDFADFDWVKYQGFVR